MIDPITNGCIKEFIQLNGLEELKQSDSFEYFSSYCIFNRDYSENFHLKDYVVSGGQDCAIDAVGIFVNDVPINTIEEFDEICEKSRVNVEFCFIQAKTSKHINAAEVGSFITGVREFFGKSYIPFNEEIGRKRNLCSHIYESSIKFKTNPKVSMFYVYLGNFLEDPTVVGRKNSEIDILKSLNLFSKVEFDFIDNENIQTRYQETNLRVEKQIVINEYAALPEIKGITQSYIGVLPCQELIKIISNSDGNLYRNIFNENVRDFLGYNDVNKEIRNTITSESLQSMLPALNNGITIVCRSIKIVGKKFTISDYQVVNGCQTSHVIFYNKDVIKPETSIVVKIIELVDDRIINDIVVATNSQTEVKDEAFVVLTKFHKRLEKFFDSVEGMYSHGLVYERRKRQYINSGYNVKDILTLPFLTKAFVACCLDSPVDALDYYGILLQKFDRRIFQENHSLWPYLACARIIKEIEYHVRGSSSSSAIWRFRYLIGAMIRKRVGKFPAMKNEEDQSKYCEKVINLCNSPEKTRALISECEKFIAERISTVGDYKDRLNANQNRGFVGSILASWK